MALMMYVIQAGLLYVLGIYIKDIGLIEQMTKVNAGGRDFSFFFSKFLATVATHFALIPKFQNGMAIMKYVANHPTRFDHQKTAFGFGLATFIFSCIHVCLHSLVLYTRANVLLTLCSYCTLYIICAMPNHYYLAFS